MATIIPDWLRISPETFVRAGAEGAEAGLSAARTQQQGMLQSQQMALEAQHEANRASEASARLAQEQEIAGMEAQVRKQIAEKEAMRKQSALAVNTAMREAQLGLDRQRIDIARQQAQAKAREAAMTFADERGFLNAVSGGASVPEALFKFPRTKPSVATMLNRLAMPKEAQIVEHEETPGVKFLRQPTGYEVPIERPDRGMSEGNRISVMREISRLRRQRAEALPEDRRQIDEEIAKWNKELPQKSVEAPAAEPKTPDVSRFKEGQKIRSKKDPTKVFVVRNGKPVPIDEDKEQE